MFKKGKSGNPLGRPKGSVNKLARIRDDWIKSYNETGGTANWLKLRKEDFSLYMRLGTQMLPREVGLTGNLDTTLTVKIVRFGDGSDASK